MTKFGLVSVLLVFVFFLGGCLTSDDRKTSYTVTYDGNGNSGGSVPEAQKKIFWIDLVVRANTGNLVKNGYTFSGWNTADDGTGTDYPAEASYTSDADITLYAKWTIEIVEGPDVTDYDGNIYTSIVIGEQTWTVQNLRTTKYNDGTPIPHVTTEWENLSTPGYCYYDNDSASNAEKYGALYNWYAVDTKKLAPDGWHIPTDADWTKLEEYLIGNGYNWDGSLPPDPDKITIDDNKIAKSLASQTDWKSSPNSGAIGNELSKNNASGFSALPGGYRNYNGGCNLIGCDGYFWSASESGADHARYRYLHYDFDYLRSDGSGKGLGLSVRLLRN